MDAKRVLVIDDSEDIRDAYELLLQHEGYEVATASNGREGLQLARSFCPDVLIVDIVMPVMDGIEFLHHLRSDFAPPLPPVILSSGFDGIEKAALPQGAYAFVPKPISPPEFLELLADALAKHVPDEGALARARERTARARGAAVHAAEEAIADAPFGAMIGSAGKVLTFLSGYFDADVAFAAVIRNGSLTMLGTHGAAQPGEPPASIGEIIATGSTLVLTDVSKHASLMGDLKDMSGIRSFVGVPIAARSGVTAGAICLARKRVEPFSMEDVLILQVGARRASLMLERVNDGGEDPFGDFPFIVTGGALKLELFQFLVEMELRLAAQHQDAIELALVELGGPITPAVFLATNRAVDPCRWATGEVDPRRIAFFKRTRESAEATRQIDAAAEVLRVVVPLRGLGAVAVAGSCAGLVDAPMLFRLAERELARSSDRGRVERLLLAPAPAAPHAAP